MGRFRALSPFVCLLAFSGGARAESVVRLGGSCVPDGTTTERTLSILQAELAPLDVARLDDSPPLPGASVVVIGLTECTAEPPGARVTVWTNGAPRTRLVSLVDAEPGSRDRTLALSLAEATRDLALPYLAPSPEETPNTAVEPTPPPQVPTPPSPTDQGSLMGPNARAPMPVAPDASARNRHGDDRFLLLADALVRVVASPGTLVGGGEIGGVYRKATVSVRALGTERSVGIGTVRLFAVVAAPAFDVAELFPTTRLRIGVEGGVATASASAVAPARSSSATAAHLGGSLGLATAVPLGGGLALQGFLDLGYAGSLTVRADDREIAGLGGLYGTLGLGLRFPVE